MVITKIGRSDPFLNSAFDSLGNKNINETSPLKMKILHISVCTVDTIKVI